MRQKTKAFFQCLSAILLGSHHVLAGGLGSNAPKNLKAPTLAPTATGVTIVTGDPINTLQKARENYTTDPFNANSQILTFDFGNAGTTSTDTFTAGTSLGSLTMTLVGSYESDISPFVRKISTVQTKSFPASTGSNVQKYVDNSKDLCINGEKTATRGRCYIQKSYTPPVRSSYEEVAFANTDWAKNYETGIYFDIYGKNAGVPFSESLGIAFGPNFVNKSSETMGSKTACSFVVTTNTQANTAEISMTRVYFSQTGRDPLPPGPIVAASSPLFGVLLSNDSLLWPYSLNLSDRAFNFFEEILLKLDPKDLLKIHSILEEYAKHKQYFNVKKLIRDLSKFCHDKNNLMTKDDSEEKKLALCKVDDDMDETISKITDITKEEDLDIQKYLDLLRKDPSLQVSAMNDLPSMIVQTSSDSLKKYLEEELEKQK